MLTLFKFAWKWASKHVKVKANANEYDEIPKGAFVLVKEKLHLFGTTNVYVLVYVEI